LLQNVQGKIAVHTQTEDTATAWSALPIPTNTSSSLKAALLKLKETLGENCVLDDNATIDLYSRTTIAATIRPRAIIKPVNRQQIQSIVEVCAAAGVRLYPISTGRNWGYGSATPVEENCCVLDLSELKEIRFIDQRLGLVSVEPGVTQQALADFLDDHGSELMVPVHGGGPDCSLIGNALERGYGLTPTCDHFSALTALSAVLADGTAYESPLSEFSAGWLQAHKWGIGPYMDGLFSQSNFGIVTRATLALEQRPEHVEAFFVRLGSDDTLPAVVESIQSILQNLGGQVIGMNLMNARRVLSMSTPYPRTELSTGIMDAELLARLQKETGVPAWTLAGVIQCPFSLRRDIRREIAKRLHKTNSRPLFIDHRRLNAIGLIGRLPILNSNLLRTQVASIEALLDLASGRPNRVALPLAYWLRGKEVDRSQPINPAHDGRGLIWFSPLVPMLGNEVRQFSEIVNRICAAHQIEPLITLTTLSERLFDATVPILFDQLDKEAARRAWACYDELLLECEKCGFVPYRLPNSKMAKFASQHLLSSWSLARRLRTSLDPDGVVSPGRYSTSTEGLNNA
jgi:4-cresol dehydrogenase (hydroxylating) flavoprotein subunit